MITTASHLVVGLFMLAVAVPNLGKVPKCDYSDYSKFNHFVYWFTDNLISKGWAVVFAIGGMLVLRCSVWF